MELEKRLYNGDRAKEVLENEAYIQAMADLKSEIVEVWTKSPARDSDGREKLFQLLKMADKFEAILKTSLETGRLAKEELRHKQTLADRAKRVVGLI